jgi:ABC-type Fe3+/spermidine/putrescine transport system ATPase subunit
MDEVASKNSEKIACFIEDVHTFEQLSYSKAISQRTTTGTRTRKQIKAAKTKESKAAAVDSKVADVTLSSQSSSSSTSSSTVNNELQIEVSKLQDQLEKSKTNLKKAESNRDVSYQF